MKSESSELEIAKRKIVKVSRAEVKAAPKLQRDTRKTAKVQKQSDQKQA